MLLTACRRGLLLSKASREHRHCIELGCKSKEGRCQPQYVNAKADQRRRPSASLLIAVIAERETSQIKSPKEQWQEGVPQAEAELLSPRIVTR
jgi:hypothetical protein